MPIESARVLLTDRYLRARKPTRHAVEYFDRQQPGLIARVLPSGIIQFGVRYRFQGKQKRLKFGVYPAVLLRDARKRARYAQAAIDDGRDPAGERHAAKAERTDTLAALAEDYLKKHARKHKRSAGEDERILNADVLPAWRDKSVRDLTRRDVRALVEDVAERAPIMANRVLALIRKMLNFAVDQDWIDANPAARVQKPAHEVARERVLTDEELRRVWRVLSNPPATTDKPAPGRARANGTADDPLCPISAPLAALLKVRLLTAQRGGEVMRMRWTDLDLDSKWWTIPGTDTKNGESHRVPLTDHALDLIRSQRKKDDDREYVFVGQGASLRDRAKKAPSAIAHALAINFRGHDLRRTAATRMAEAGIPRDHIAKVLNHVEGGPRATRVYDRHTYDREKRLALETWARVLKGILENKSDANVVPFSATRA
jgi:integrase